MSDIKDFKPIIEMNHVDIGINDKTCMTFLCKFLRVR